MRGDRLVQALAHLDDVAALLHRHAQADHFLAVEAHLVLRRILVFALDGGEVAQAEGGAVGAQLQVFQVLDASCSAPVTRTCRLSVGVTSTPVASTAFWVAIWLTIDFERHAQLGELLVRELDVDLLVLHAELLDLRHQRHLQQLLAHEVGVVLHLGVGEAVARQREDRAVGVAEFVVEERAEHARRQGGRDVADLLAHLVPGRRASRAAASIRAAAR